MRSAALVAAAALVSGVLCWAAYRIPPASTSDFETFWIAARALLSGDDPYAVLPTVATGYPFYYPLTGTIIVAPLALLPFSSAQVVWAALSGAALALAALRYGRGLPTALLSACFLNAVVYGQWSPMLTAAAAMPALAGVWAAKPSIGAALFAAYPSRRALVGGLVLLGLSLAVYPTWPSGWMESLRSSVQVAPIMRPGGAVLLLAFLQWRRPEGRLLGCLACVPQTIGLYDALPLFLLPRTRWQGYALAVLSYLAAFSQAHFVPRLPGMSWEVTSEGRWPYMFVCLYLPALILLFLNRREQVSPGGTAG